MSAQETITKIYEDVRWLENNGKSQAISDIVLKLDSLSILCLYFSESVSDAYAAKAEDEEAYKYAVAKHIADSKESAAKAKEQAFVEYASLRKTFIESDSLYQKLRMKLDRLDTILDTHRQRVSLLKMLDLKSL